ncbi:DUF4150 domain-containing protein [Pseudenhygromyxa sp. WMMC2535]|uniref:DUF4150 domain-containing protein n=1 Tax=Pseudenhygromyxa sp. WMMC2535 TaxID=2712867 RepID=UPI001552219A|nr:DUF4150 domain-containing protein [Pseudenhygromyxa sp. WMMC2535]NVB42296.1 DUF4150 domain-containing protein [Pseudenhygromyxa sp. WMMC2535]
MALTVFAEKMGFWHRGSDGFGVAPLDVCLSPPPGPVPIPYTNFLRAIDLVKGSKTVHIDGEPTALENASETSTSTGDEGGTLGGSVITGKILGKGYFTVWSMTVFIEGMGVARHGDLMGQNSASAPGSTYNGGAVNTAANPQATVPPPVAKQQAGPPAVLQATGPGNSKPKQLIPCDFEKISFSCGHTKDEDKRKGKVFEFTFDGNIKDNLAKGPKDKPYTKNIQLTAGPDDFGADELSIKISGGPGFACGKGHPKVAITDRATGKTTTKDGELDIKFKAKCKRVDFVSATGLTIGGALAYFWFSPKTTNTYIVEIGSCGVLANLNPGFRKLSRTVEVFSGDTYKLSISLPPSLTVKSENGEPLVQGARQPSAWDNEGVARAKALRAKASQNFVFERNGEDYSSKLNIGNIIALIVHGRDALAAIMDDIDGLKVGVKPVCEVEFFTGSLSIEWGAKEWTDQRVYRWWKIEAQLTLVKLKVGIAAGLEFFKDSSWAVVGVLEGAITGEVPLSLSAEAEPDKPKPTELGVAGKITGAVTATGQLGDRWLFIEGVIQASLSVEASFAIGENVPCELNHKIHWSGLETEAKVESKIFGSLGSKKITLIEGGILSEGPVFDPKPKPAQTTPRRRRRRS